MRKGPWVGAACVGLGIGIGLLVPNSLYIYGGTESVPFRVNRLTGVQQFTSPWGWVSQAEIDRRVDEKIEPEIARFNERLVQMRLASDQGRLRKVEVMGRQVSAYYSDGHKEEYYATDLSDPRLGDAENIAQKVAADAPSSTLPLAMSPSAE